ncbi:MAG: hypothetical protein A2Y91_04965 [Chloroflexi bacterium RBG_13_54_8]|nr:MAG: hypothetical protein A2Y91_04965 [Chloroflexi bacterium RBG_13_54_8]
MTWPLKEISSNTAVASDSVKVTALICALNEVDSLPHVLTKLPTWVDEVLLVDGHSTDGTVEIAKKIRPDMKILCQPGRGKGDALKYGVRQASGDIIITLDADGANNPDDMPKFVEPLLNGYDVAKGSRLVYGRPTDMRRHRWVGNKILVLTINLLYGTRFTDICSGYNAFWKKAFLCLDLANDSFQMEQEMLVRATKAGLKIVEIPHRAESRIGGKSKVSSVRQGFIDWVTVIVGRFKR